MKPKWYQTSPDEPDTSTHAAFDLDGVEYTAFAGVGYYGVAFRRPGYPGYKRIESDIPGGRAEAEAAAERYYLFLLGGVAV